MIFNDGDIIVAPATPSGGALCIVRVSGEGSIALCDGIFKGRCRLSEARHASAHYGLLVNNAEVIDDVVATIYRAPHSYTGEESVEISTHGSRYIVGEVIALLISRGARMAEAGEFTRRAFLAGRMDLSQAEAVADVIASDSKASYSVAATQMRGGYSAELGRLREELLHISSLLELELDFSEEDVEFADRGELQRLLEQISTKVAQLANSFALGNALKEGVTVAIAGRPNVGKSTLLNRLVGEDRAMVSDIAGTTRDTVEAVRNIGGVLFRFIDTAGLHSTDDRLEMMGIERAREILKKARIILWLTDEEKGEELPWEREGEASKCGGRALEYEGNTLEYEGRASEQIVLRVVNKIDLLDKSHAHQEAATADRGEPTTLYISAKRGDGVDTLMEHLRSEADASAAYQGDVIVSNQRHYEALQHALTALDAALTALSNNLPSDLLSEDIRQVMYHLGTITGEITSQDILQSIFSKFCIGK